MAYLADSIWVNVSTSGTADFTTTTALAGYRTFADASVPNGSTIHYSARSATQFENGEGIYSSGTGIVTRATIFASSSAGAKVNFSGSPTLVVAPLAEDFGASSLTIGTTTITGGTTKHVLYDLAGEVEEAANFTIESGDPNVLSGNSYLYNNVSAIKAITASSNWHFGSSGNMTASGTRNTSVGYNSLAALTTGTLNVVIGSYAGDALTEGVYNTFIGDAAGGALTTASYNTAIGQGALGAASTGATQCVAVGQNAIGASSGGTRNVAIGGDALANAQSSSSDNVAIGANAADALTTGSDNFSLGFNALSVLTTGSRNVAIGSAALAALSAAGTAGNIAVGYSAGTAITTGTQNTVIGYAASGITEGASNVIIGDVVSAVTTGNSNVVVGSGTGGGLQTGNGNTIIGSGITGLSSGLASGLILASSSTIRIDYNKTTASVLTLNADTAVLGTLRLQGYTIAGTLPAAGTAGRRAYVTNSAASPAFMATLTGGGSTIVPVFDDGTNWRYG